jgi:short-subunit dehydrogenase
MRISIFSSPNLLNIGGNMNKGTALVTGATSGLGYDFASILAQKGYNLFLASRNEEKLNEIKTGFEKDYGISVVTLAIDLAKSGSAQKLYEETANQNIEIDVLVNNAGFGVQGEHVDLEINKVQGMIQLNIATLTELCLFFGKDMKQKRKGHILNIASTAAYQPDPYLATYGASKSYVLNFSEALAKEMEDYQVVVTCLCPGATDTNFFNYAQIGDKKKGFFSNTGRMKSREVAAIGIDALFAGKLSVISGMKNSFLAFTNRLAPRKMSATISKKIMKDSLRG